MTVQSEFNLDLHRIVPEQNMARFYRLWIDRDLFGLWTLSRNWGRIGTYGQMQIQSFHNHHEAQKAFDRLSRQKLKRGYCILP